MSEWALKRPEAGLLGPASAWLPEVGMLQSR
jgi:hypothetical protein